MESPETIISSLTRVFFQAFQSIIANVKLSDINITVCSKPEFGQYQCNSPMVLFKRYKVKEIDKSVSIDSPKAFAEHIKKWIEIKTPPMIEKIEAHQKGFINIHLSSTWLSSYISNIISLSFQYHKDSKKVIIDFSSPNIAKSMHVGHLRSTIIGDCLYRLFEFVHYNVTGYNHLGDWGTQFGMLIAKMKKDKREKDENMNVNDLQTIYREAKILFDKDEEFKELSRNEVVRLQAKDSESIDIWKRICEISRKEFNNIYHLLNIDTNRLIERGESWYNDKLPGIIDEFKSRNLLVESDGALIFPPNEEMKKELKMQYPLILQKKDGGYNYDTTDLATLRYRVMNEEADWLVYVTDLGQEEHFRNIFQAGKKIGWIKDQKIDHAGFGVVCGADGKKFKTRSGDTVKLIDLLNEAKARCATEIRERVIKEEKDHSFSEEEVKEIDFKAARIGYGALKYFDLSKNRTTNYIFNYDQMLSLNGDTGVYLLYTYARICSIFAKKYEITQSKNIESDSFFNNIVSNFTKTFLSQIIIYEKSEWTLCLHLARFYEIIDEALKHLLPNILTKYLYELSCKFTDFYTECKVINSDKESSRLTICYAVLLCMNKLFSILGIQPIDKI